MEIEVNLGIPMLLLIGGAVGVLAICFKMKPAEKKGEGGKYKLADTEESDVIDESDPLATAEKVWQHDDKTWKKKRHFRLQSGSFEPTINIYWLYNCETFPSLAQIQAS